MTINASTIAQIFEDPRKAVDLSLLPAHSGIYALRNHRGELQYVGITTMTIRKRVEQYHVAGDGNSHKYSSVYNGGLLWSERKHPANDKADGQVAKKVRRLFCRATCTAAGIIMPDHTKSMLREIETQVINILGRQLAWNGKKALPAEIITINDIRSSGIPVTSDDLSALERQNQRWIKTQTGDKQ